MAARAFYVIQGMLEVFERDQKSNDRLRFADSDDGLRAFDRYLSESDAVQSLIVIDVIEEVFATDSIPKLNFNDRRALLKRRVGRKFPRTPFRLSVSGRANGENGETVAVHSSISNHELLDPWLTVILRHRVPLTGIFSVPLMAPEMLKRFFKTQKPVLFLTQHQGQKLRQVFIQDGLAKSARLSQTPPIDDDGYAAAISTEIQRSRRYLERSRLLSGMEELDVCMMAGRAIADRIVRDAEPGSPLQFHFIDPDVAEKRLKAGSGVPVDHLERFYISTALRHRPGHSYAVSGEQRYWRMSQLRRAAIGFAFGTAAACSAMAGVYFGDALRLHRSSTEIDSLVTQLSETYRRENESFGPIKADSYEMKLAVDTGDYILEQRVPVPWVMQQLGAVLGDYPDVRVTALSWEAQTPAATAPPRQRPGEAALPVPIPAVNAVTAEMTGTLDTFDGDLRKAFARIDRLVADIASRTAFAHTFAVEYPIDASPRSSVSGEISGDGVVEEARFRLRMTYQLVDDPADGENVDDPV
ncbi:MAG: hypothetical protein QNJ00_16400 [Woeseiaceae bacterium]|nr:hypothetical protein [Woeseiaceae bacterium]